MDQAKVKEYVEQTKPLLEAQVKLAEAIDKELPGVLNVLVANGILSENVKEATGDKIRSNPAEALSLIRKLASEVITDKMGSITDSKSKGSGKLSANEQFERDIIGA